MESLSIDGAWAFTPQIHRDDRGSFHESFRGGELADTLGYPMGVAQANCSVSRRGVIRGIHFADVPPGQAKYVSCAAGAILDVVVDLRAGSPTFAAWAAVQLDDENRRAVFLSEGLGHAFMALSEEATVLYLCSTPYAPAREHSVDALDPDIGIEWPVDVKPILSDQDAAAPSLRTVQTAGLLPDYAACLAYAAQLRGPLAAR
ncbi:MAG: dTDP-4-dehydrorhamnose 3,5-epimerase family protein [Streptosporangiaceae bacterium]